MSHNWHSSVSHTRADAPYSGFMESTRQTWNDERMDEFAGRTEENFKEVRAEIRDTRTELRVEIQEVRTELKGDIRDLRGEMNGRFAKLEDKFDRRFDILLGAMATGFVGLIVTHFIG
jgi:hypothetical protein